MWIVRKIMRRSLLGLDVARKRRVICMMSARIGQMPPSSLIQESLGERDMHVVKIFKFVGLLVAIKVIRIRNDVLTWHR